MKKYPRFILTFVRTKSRICLLKLIETNERRNKMKTKTEKYSSGKWDVLTVAPYPVRVGHIIGGNKRYLAEMGGLTLGYFNTLKQAQEAIEKNN